MKEEDASNRHTWLSMNFRLNPLLMLLRSFIFFSNNPYFVK